MLDYQHQMNRVTDVDETHDGVLAWLMQQIDDDFVIRDLVMRET